MALYYIDPTGNNTGTGSAVSPWLTLSYACTRAKSSGDIIYINSGTYPVDVSQAVLSINVNVQGEGYSSHIITDYYTSSSYSGYLHLWSPSLTDSSNQSISNFRLTGKDTSATCAINIVDRNNVKIYDMWIEDFSGRGINIRHDGGGSTFLTGTEIYDCNINNCADRLAVSSCGLIVDKGTDGTNIHHNTLTQNSRATNHNGNIYNSWDETNDNKNTKFHYNTCYKPDSDGSLNDAGGWNFHIESGGILGGVEIYQNTFYGGVAVDLAAASHTKGDSEYSVWIHHNKHYLTNQLSYVTGVPRAIFVDLERTCEDVIVEYNYSENVTEAIANNLTAADSYIERFKFRYNICINVGYSPTTTNPWRGGVQIGTNNSTGYGHVDDCEIYNNVIIGNGIISGIGLYALTDSSVKNIKIRNNIIQGIVSWGWLVFRDSGGDYEDIYAENNIIYDCVNDDAPYYENDVSVNNYVAANNIVADPSFISSTNFQLQVNSPAINAGIDVSIASDYIGTSVPQQGITDIGAYESNYITAGLLGYWKLDETTGNALDSLGAVDGLVYGATQGTTGKIKTAYTFTATENDYVDCGKHCKPTTGISISLWLKADTQTSDYAGIINNIKYYGVGDQNGYNLFIDSSKLLFELYNRTSYIELYNTTEVVDNNWYFAVCTWDGSNAKIYLNNILESSIARTTPIAYDTDSSLRFGSHSSSFDYTGILDEIGIWSRALTLSEISTIYNGGNGLSYPFIPRSHFYLYNRNNKLLVINKRAIGRTT